MNPTVGNIVHSYFEDYLKVQKGLRISSIRSYRDSLRLFLDFIARSKKKPIVKLSWSDLTVAVAFRIVVA